jgi:crotonobetainyl-CoA:carnitine CoA-transferase CaiB-like acyl-CoA transferase
MQGAETHDVPASKVNSIDDLPADPQVMHNEIFVERQHPLAGTIREPRPAPRFSHTPATVSSLAPRFGEHSDEIAAELGFDAATLRAAGVIHGPTSGRCRVTTTHSRTDASGSRSFGTRFA